MKNTLKNTSVILSVMSLVFVLITIGFLIFSFAQHILNLYSYESNYLIILSLVLLASTSIPFILSALASNLMIAAYSKEKKIQYVRLVIILIFSPFLILLTVVPFILIIIVSFIYGEIAGFLSEPLNYWFTIDKNQVKSWVSFFIVGECLFYAYRYSLFDWFLSLKETTSVNIAEKQYQVIYEGIDTKKEKRIADFVKVGIRISAINLVAVLFWSYLMLSNLSSISIETLFSQTMIVALFFSLIPMALFKLYKARKNRDNSKK